MRGLRRHSRKFWIGAAAIVSVPILLLVVLELMRVPAHFTLERAEEAAHKRFVAYAVGYALAPSDFAPPVVRDYGDEWHFRWRFLKGEGEIVVIVHQNGLLSDGGDVRLSPERRRE